VKPQSVLVRVVVLSLVAGFAPAALVAARTAGAADAAPATVPCPAELPDAPSALAAAHACGGRVEVSAQRSETEQTFANPDGSHTVEVSVVPRWVRQADRSWSRVDTSLRTLENGSLAPVATAVPLELSGGGSGPFATVTTAADHGR